MPRQIFLPGRGNGGQQINILRARRRRPLRRGGGGAEVGEGGGLDQGVHVGIGQGQDGLAVSGQGTDGLLAVQAIGEQLHDECLLIKMV
jgi:hypothetical protein